MIERRPKRGEKIIYQVNGSPETRQEYIVMGIYNGRKQILNICTPQAWKHDKGHSQHTQIIWKHADGLNPLISFKEGN